ncbi:MAG: sn-glycerol-3-phosphate ABC transporter ATP-binding protein UgpC [Acidobacteria bacterium]|nr:MAG: sn-glycerol-3-phosphate ABC transporter ATP-binding protein UgpC [Acidobacteriota bacterium]
MARVALAGVRKVYDNGFVAVENATFDIHDGELMVLVGPSGCGKSTLLRMIAGLETVTSGTITIGDRVVNDVPPKQRDVAMVFQRSDHTPHNPIHVPPKQRDIAMVFQNYALYPHMSVYDNMAFGLKLRHLSKEEIDQRVRRSASMLGLETVLARKPRQLSGGQRQRVALGRALVREPAAFLLDEPLSNLDAKLRLQTRAEIARLHQRLTATMIYVTHDQIEAMTLGQRIVVLDAGRIQQIDTPLNLYRHPANRFVAGFIGSPPMNFIEGRVDDGRFVANDGSIALPVRQIAKRGPVVLGIRPEHIMIGRNGTSATFTLDLIEPVGNEVFVYATAGGNQIVARVPPQDMPQIGRPIDLTFDAKSLHFFEPESGTRMA